MSMTSLCLSDRGRSTKNKRKLAPFLKKLPTEQSHYQKNKNFFKKTLDNFLDLCYNNKVVKIK